MKLSDNLLLAAEWWLSSTFRSSVSLRAKDCTEALDHISGTAERYQYYKDWQSENMEKNNFNFGESYLCLFEAEFQKDIESMESNTVIVVNGKKG